MVSFEYVFCLIREFEKKNGFKPSFIYLGHDEYRSLKDDANYYKYFGFIGITQECLFGIPVLNVQLDSHIGFGI